MSNADFSLSSSWLTAIRSAWNTRAQDLTAHLGWTADLIVSASLAVEAISPPARVLTIAFATPRACRSSPYSLMIRSISSRELPLTISAAVNVRSRSMRMSSGPSDWNEKPRPGVSIW